MKKMKKMKKKKKMNNFVKYAGGGGEENIVCYRCGRIRHSSNECYAKFHVVDGLVIDSYLYPEYDSD